MPAKVPVLPMLLMLAQSQVQTRARRPQQQTRIPLCHRHLHRRLHHGKRRNRPCPRARLRRDRRPMLPLVRDEARGSSLSRLWVVTSRPLPAQTTTSQIGPTPAEPPFSVKSSDSLPRPVPSRRRCDGHLWQARQVMPQPMAMRVIRWTSPCLTPARARPTKPAAAKNSIPLTAYAVRPT